MANKKLVGTDALLVQRLNTAQDKELYHITVDQLSSYVGINGDAYQQDLVDRLDDAELSILNLEESVSVLYTELTIIKLDVARHEEEIELIEKSVSDLRLNIDEINTKAKVNLNYRWIQNTGDTVDPDNIQPGEMYAEWDGIDDTIVKLFYSTTDDDGYAVTQPYIFEGETLELSSAYNPSPSNPSKLRYRSVHLVDQEPNIKTNYISIEVTTVHEFNDGDFPYYVEGVNEFITRSDFYPNALNIDAFEQEVRENYLPLDGHESMTGDLTIDTANPKINLISSGDDSYINARSKLTFLKNNVPTLEISDKVYVKIPLDAGNQRISNVQKSSTPSDAATVGYVNDQISNLQSNVDEKFEPGDQVAKMNSSSGVEVGGFALISGTLYVRTS